jgi:hypothetical protein
MIVISIPKYSKIKDEKGEYTAFEVHVAKPGASSVIEKRYSHFSKLDKRLRKIIYTPNLPPKTLMNKGSKLLETRREGLERYLQALIGTIEVYDILSEFLETHLPTSTPSRAGTTSAVYDMDTEDYASPHTTHQNLLLFTKDPVIRFYEREGNFIADWNCIPDTVIRGVLAGIYEHEADGAAVQST